MGVGVPTRVHVPGLLSDDLFYTDCVEIVLTVGSSLDAQQQQQAVTSVTKCPLQCCCC